MRLIDADVLKQTVFNNSYSTYKTIGGNGYIDHIFDSMIVGTINTNKKVYRCAYCGTMHEHNMGTCDRCGAPMSEALEIKE